MTIENGLEALPDKKAVPEAVPEAIPSGDIMARYPAELNKAIMSFGKRTKKPYDSAAVAEFSQWMKFRDDLSVDISVPKKDLIELVSAKDEAFKVLLATDVAEYLNDPFDVCDKDEYYNLPEYLNLANVIDCVSLIEFQICSQKCVVIPDADYLSLFFEHGEDVREFAKCSAEKPFFLIYERGVKINVPDIFTADNLANYVKATGRTQVKDFFEQTHVFFDMMQQYGRDNGISGAIELLFKRLVQFNPHLIYKESK